MRLCFDIEATNLLNSFSVDYNASPYKLKDDFKVHCVAFEDMDTGETYDFVEKDVYKHVKEFILDSATELMGHNIITYDLPVLKAAIGLDFKVGIHAGVKSDKYYDKNHDEVCGKIITITDTLVMSKTLNPDRPQHNLEYFGRMHGEEKIDWRAIAIELGLIKHDAPKGSEFLVYHPEMLRYNKQDVTSNIKTWKLLLKEWGDWNWSNAYELEKAVAEIIMRQEHRGFWFNTDLAVENVKVLDERMAELKAVVEPLIPPKPLTKGAAQDYIPPKIQFKKNGELSANIIKWVEKHKGEIKEVAGSHIATIFGKLYILPMAQEPILTHEPATIRDTTHIKGWLVDMGWNPSAYKERDLTCSSKKQKLTTEKYIIACEKYIAQTMASPFMKDRLEHLEVYSEEYLRKKLLKHDHMKRPLKVATNPTLTVGQEKEIDPMLLAMNDKFAHAKDISDYLTYSHRRNSILGGGADPDDWDDDEDEETGKGWLAAPRVLEDHRIPTPADTCGAGTSRFKHRLVANIPRVTSPFGKEMRALFGVAREEGFFQLGYDFDGLEARIESHYCYKYDDDEKSYCNSLLGEKPNDVHTLTAKKISEVIGEAFGRTPAKSVKYACSYGARPKRVAKTVGCSVEMGERIFDAFWLAAQPLAKLMEQLTKYWETTGGKKFILGIDGRKIPTRSASALVNSLFQSAGVICAKRAMVIHDRKLRDNDLAVDFWIDDWKAKKFCQQLIAYHDEGQLEVHKSMIEWKLFDKEEDAKAFKKEHPTWSDIGHSEKGYYVGLCKAGILAVESVNEAGQYYKLNVALTAGYMLGTNWATCH